MEMNQIYNYIMIYLINKFVLGGRRKLISMKVLIYFRENELAPCGGPAGYLYNIREELKKRKIDYIDFLPQLEEKNKLKKIYKKIEPKFLRKIKNVFRNGATMSLKMVNSKTKKLSDINLNEYDIIHFHTTISMYSVKDSLSEYKGKVLLTSHSPKVTYKEIIDANASRLNKLMYKKRFEKLSLIDEYAFNRADYIIFPTEEAEECYYNTWEKYKEIHNKNKDKYIYIPTGIKRIDTTKFNKEEIRKKYNIPKDAFVVCYIGRHNTIKGYDQLKKIGEKILKQNKNIYFLVAGNEKPLKGINNSHWIEIGWTNNPHEIVYSSNIFVLPNKETYFDLILLEVMSIGKTIVLTNTGGNKYFKRFTENGLFFYEYGDINSACKTINKLSTKKNIERYGERNKDIFNNNFTIETFTQKYIEIINNIAYGRS